ncbi:E3 ubiquitin-protein ligase RNF181-like [Rhodamnia argentea]|uniref:RING-type E3 ubiquitin transferase n=1 Tax=Rhodamnia argentea TaxID=178133 RepID=A0A8B8QRI0_9MYRT|nr:E3 ubiquitin-protein ligase RNF181-like [Rhodamnia argentea]
MYEFSFPADQLSRDAAGEQNVRDMLTEVGVMYTRHHEFMVQMVLSRAASMAGDERNREAKVLPMRVSISCADPRIHRELMMSEEEEDEGLATSYDEGEDMDTSEDSDEEEAAMIGQWLAGLMEVEATERSVDCAICCEEIIVGSTASSMPCCHVYHRGCIAKWLKNSRTCPLCRFELPSTYYH